jgi:outer membrane protein assembly factor BamD
MTYYRMMVKPDRDSSEAVNAEAEFQTFVQKYPNSKLEPQAEQRLREVQEVLAEGDFRISRFYYLRGSNRAAAGRLIELVQRYPLYSRADQANWMLGQIYEKSEKKEIAANYYANIVKNYPLSPLAGDAKSKLVAFGVPVPQPDPGAMARMQEEQNTPRPRSNLLTKSMGMLKNGPDVTEAAHHGAPNLEPPSEAGAESLTPGGMSAGGPGASGGAGSPGTTAVVETVTPGTASTAAGSPDATATGATGDAPVGNNGPDSPTQSAPGASDAGGATVGGTAAGSVGNTTQGSTGSADSGGSGGTTGDAPAAASTAAACPPATAAPAGSAAATAGSGAGSCPATTTTTDSKNESSSKKKKKKLFPW